MAQVVFEEVYKSFPARGDGRKPSSDQTPQAMPSVNSGRLPQGKGHSGLTSDLEPKLRTGAAPVNVLRRINFTVKDGEFMVLVGPSGCGKSTLLRLIAGLEELTAGNIWIGDRKINHLPPKARDIAMVFQSYALYPHMSVYNNLAFGLRRAQAHPRGPGHQGFIPLALLQKNLSGLWGGLTRSLPKPLRYRSRQERQIEQKVLQVADVLQIESLLDRLPKQLSGGQKQRVALGRAMARDPQVFLMDEPLSNLDAKLRAQTRAQIVKLQRQLGTTTVYVTHDQTEAMTMGDRIAVMNTGQIQQIASPLELYHQPTNRFVAQFIGSPPMNFISVTSKPGGSLHHPLFTLELPEVWHGVLQDYEGQLLTLGIRPEHLDIAVQDSHHIPMQVELVEALGHETYLSLHFAETAHLSETTQPEQPFIARIDPQQPIRMGERLWLAIQLDQIHLFDPQTEAALRPSSG